MFLCLRYMRVSLCIALAGAALMAMSASSIAEVKVVVDRRDHVVQGTTAGGLVRSMNANPVRGDHGSAYASIHPNFSLSVSTAQKGGICRADVDVRLSFALTLPRAASPGSLSGKTWSAWMRFVSFATAHEAHHQASYTNCAKSFVARAERQSAKQCFSLQSDIRTMFSQMKRDCEAIQRSYDRAQAKVLPGLSLFAMARAQNKRR